MIPKASKVTQLFQDLSQLACCRMKNTKEAERREREEVKKKDILVVSAGVGGIPGQIILSQL